MSVLSRRRTSPIRALGAGFSLAVSWCLATPVAARQPSELVGTWDLTFDGTGTVCRVMLRGQRSDKGDYFLGMPTACRHAMPGIAAVGRWSMPDAGHVVLADPGGTALVSLDAMGDGYVGAGPAGRYALKPLPAEATAGVAAPSAPPPAAAPALPIERVATKRARAAEQAPTVTKDELAGRYAVMREKRDTGCMLTLDKTRSSGGDRAQLAPGCRDQGIVIFDPSSWQLIKGELVLTARAGHKASLERTGEGLWAKDPKASGKPLGLKKL